MRLADHVTLNFNANVSTAALFLDIAKACDTTWHSGLLYKLSELEFSTSFIKVISFLTDRKLEVLVEGELSTPRKIAAGMLQGSILSRGNWNASCTVLGRYQYLRDRET
jgi:hypothetical protein